MRHARFPRDCVARAVGPDAGWIKARPPTDAQRLLNLVALFSTGELPRLSVRVMRDDGTWEDLELSGGDQEERDASLLRLLRASRD